MKTYQKITNLLENREYGPTTSNPWRDYRQFSSLSSFAARLCLAKKLQGHEGCVNSITWNDKGTRILSGSDDTRLKIWDVGQEKALKTIETGHATNIFCARFMTFSDEQRIVSCSADGAVKHLDLETASIRPFNCHTDMAYEVAPDPENPNIFFTCSEDGTVRQIDLRLKDRCDCEGCSHGIYIKLQRTRNRPIGILTMALRTLKPVSLSIGCADGFVRTYDRRMISEASQQPVYQFCPEHLITTPDKRHRITSLKYNYNGSQIIVSYSGEHIYLVEPESNLSLDDIKEIQKRWKEKLKRFENSNTQQDSQTDNNNNNNNDNNTQAAGSLAQATHRLSSVILERLFHFRSDSSSDQDEEEGQPHNESTTVDSTSMETGRVRPISEHNESPHVKRIRSLSVSDESSPSGYDKDIRMVYCGHRNVRTMIKEANFFGPYSQYAVSGSDDGRVFLWERDSGDLVNYFTGDKRVVNCVQGHPTLPILAVSGIDDDIKIFEPTAEVRANLSQSEDIMRHNQRLLQEHQDVLVVPASMVLRLLSVLPGNVGNITLTFSPSFNESDEDNNNQPPPP
jgi:WD40 repeat protein